MFSQAFDVIIEFSHGMNEEVSQEVSKEVSQEVSKEVSKEVLQFLDCPYD